MFKAGTFADIGFLVNNLPVDIVPNFDHTVFSEGDDIVLDW